MNDRLDASAVHLWYRMTAALGAADVEAARASLSADERARCDRFHFDEDRRDYTIAHDLLRRCLSLYGTRAPADWQFETGPHGKPSLTAASNGAAGLSFNLTHTRGLVACAIGRDRDVGIDAERTSRPVQSKGIASRYFSPAEAAALEGCADSDRPEWFAELWTLKEAALKATGAGMSQPLDAWIFRLAGADGIECDAAVPIDPRQWHFALFAPAPDVRLAAAARGAVHPAFVARPVTGEHLAAPALAVRRSCVRCGVGPGASSA